MVWTKEKIIKTLKSIFINHNIITNKLLIKLSNKKKICNPSLIRQKFGSLENACNQAKVKFENNKGKGIWTKEKIYEVGKQLSFIYKKLNKDMLLDLNKKGIICGSIHISRRVGNLKNFFASVGIEYDIKSYIDMYGIEGAKNKIEKIKISNTKYSKENIINMLKDIYKENKNLKIKDLDKYSKLGKICSNNVIRKYFKTYKNLFKQANIPFQDYYWSKKRIIKQLKFLDKKYGPLAKCQINYEFSKQGLICRVKCIRDAFGSLENVAKVANIEFAEAQEKGYHNSRVGFIERKKLDKIEKEKNIKLKRQFRVEINNNIYFIDGYDTINNIAYEVDELHHKYKKQMEYDIIREDNIKEVLNCDFVRIEI